jgi:hypothetical protein
VHVRVAPPHRRHCSGLRRRRGRRR